MTDLFLGHFGEHFGRGGVMLPQTLGKATIDAAVLFLVGDCERENLLLGQLCEALHEVPLFNYSNQRLRNSKGSRTKIDGAPEKRGRRLAAPERGRNAPALIHAEWNQSNPDMRVAQVEV